MSGEWSTARLTVQCRASRAIGIAFLVLYAAGTLFVALHHEPWRDEADSWIVARDVPVPALLQWTRNAGTPALWYLLLKPLVRLGLPFESQSYLHLALAWTAAAVLLFRAPLPWPSKFLVLASYYSAYEYAVIARSYILTVLLSFVIATLYSRRHTHPIRYATVIALLFNANVHGALIAAIFAAMFALDARHANSRSAVAIMAAGAVAAWAQLRTAPDSAFPHIIRTIHPDAAWIAIGSAFFPGVPLIAGATAGVVVIALIAIALRRQRDAIVLLLVSVTAFECLYVFVWFGGYRHAGLLLLSVVIAIWIAGDVRRDAVSTSAAVALNAALVVSVVFSMRMAAADVRMDFSGARETALFIRDNGLGRYEIAAHNIHETEAILPWLPGKRLWYAAIDRYGTYMHWNREEEIGRQMPYGEATARAIQRFRGQRQPWLLLLNAPMPDPEENGFRLIHQTRGRVYRHRDERYWLYVRTPRSTR